MESYYAKIESDIIVTVESVSDSFFNANPTRYTGEWIKVGNGSSRSYCGVGYLYLREKDKVIPPQNYASWTLDTDDIWQPPTAMPNTGVHVWDEANLAWIERIQS